MMPIKVRLQNKLVAVYSSPLGPIGITLYHNQLSGLQFLFGKKIHSTKLYEKTLLIRQLFDELSRYFDYPKHPFNIALHIEGTPFQKRVWETLQTIPSGTTLTYGVLAKKLHTSPRAIGQACRMNRIPIIIPCHRVVAAHHTGGYMGHSVGAVAKVKEQLLQHEISPITPQRAKC